MSKTITKLGKKNIILLLVFILFWLFSFLNLGILSNFSWVALKLLLPFAGIAIIILNIFLLIILKHKCIGKRIITIILGIIFVLPILLTINVISAAYPANINTATPTVTLTSPFKTDAIVAWGGDEVENNLPHAVWSSERWAYDLVMEPYDTGDADLESYGIWNESVYSPIAGTIVGAYDQDNDIQPNQDEFESLEGNYVYIRIEETGTYLLLNHLKKDSVTVNVGDTINVGDLLGNVGNSGTSSEPHLHIHHQKENPTEMIHPIIATGLPLYFNISGKDIMPVKGSILRN